MSQFWSWYIDSISAQVYRGGMKRKQNPILAEPPVQMHALQGTGGAYFARSVGRRASKEDYYGVHTTSDFVVATTYAMNTTSKESEPGAYPVVVSICVDGLEELADVDSMVAASEAADASQLGDDVYEEADSYEHISEGDIVGQDPFYLYIDDLGKNVAKAFIDTFGDEAQEKWEDWKGGGELPVQVATNLTTQRRFPSDIDIDRIVGVDACKPVHRKVFDNWWDYDEEDGEEIKARAEAIEGAGYMIVTMEDILNGFSIEKKPIYTSHVSCARVEYHGTSSVRLRLAFPDMQIPDEPPYPVEEIDDDD